MKYIDLHADTILPLMQHGDQASLYDDPETHINIQKLQKGDALAQCFAVWLPDSNFDLMDVDPLFSPQNHEEDMAYIHQAVNRLNKEINANSAHIAWAKNASSIRENHENGKISAILTLEDARAVNDSLDNLTYLHHLGFNMMGLIWNHENCFGFPNSLNPELNQKGLKKFGIEAVQYMNDLNITIDVSHLNDGGITDVLEHSQKPVVATHSNARALALHSRNLIDEHIKGIANTGGVIGLCISPRFLNGSGDDSTISDMIRHLDYLYNKGGEDVLAIGTDFDGTTGRFEIGSPAEVPKLFERLEQHGWPLKRIEKLAYQNALRIFEK
ncbi:dipeptidase [Jeotgalibaca sp. A122]|uniref:dipeptidase n=1 Tax=Jeotgalibaca sp. A122 TaxID=3457322 RepID=UPI003FD3B8CD